MGSQTIVLTGAGSGGHITPILAVADALKKRSSDTYLVYVGQKGDSLGDIPAAHTNVDAAYSVRAGKFRRYHGEGWRQIFDVRTFLKNIRDFFFAMAGTWQAYRLLKRLKPSVIFIKGGFVGVPVGLAAAWLKIPYVTHDSDAIPGLANRIIARWASAHAVAMPKEIYSYPQDKTYFVGVPVSEEYKEVTSMMQQEYRKGLGIKSDARVITITGGGLGAERLNKAVVHILPDLLQKYPNLKVLHITGRSHEPQLKAQYQEILTPEQQKQVIVRGFVNDLYRYSAAADIILCRAGATNLAEFALQHKACIVVPNPALTGGHQLKNAKHLAEAGAIITVTEEEIKKNPVILAARIMDLFDFSEKRHALAKKFGEFAQPGAAKVLAEVILQVKK